MTDPTIAATGPGQFRVGRVFGRAFGMIGRHAFVVLLLALVASAPRLVVHYGLYGPYLDTLQRSTYATGRNTLAYLALRGLILVLVTIGQGIALPALAQALFAHAAIQHWRRRPVRLGEALWTALVRILPVLGVTILVALAIGAAGLAILVAAALLRSTVVIVIAFLATVIVGLFLDGLLYVAVPACVVERIGPLASLGRSAYLTKGHRWRVFGIVLIFALVQLVLALLGAALTVSLFRYGRQPTWALGLFVINALIAAVQALVAVAAYHDLRVAREGVDPDQIAAVFD